VTTLLSNEVLPQTLRDAGLPARDLEHLVSDLTDEQYDALQSLLCERLHEESKLGHVRISNPLTHEPAIFHSILFGGKATSKKGPVVAFSFSNAMRKGVWPIFGLVFSVFSGHLTLASLPSAMNAANALWGSLAILRSPEDDDAITVIRAIGLIKGDLRTKKIDALPTNQQIEVVTQLSRAALQTALKQLETRNIIKIARWGSQAGDYSHQENEWAARL
jgi:hypothetical protein